MTTRSVQQIGRAVKQLQVRHHRAIDAGLAPLEIGVVQWDAMRHIHENPEASLHQLAQLSFQTDQSFGALAARMIRRGLIERVPGGGRAAHHRLTAKGDELRRRGTAVVEEILRGSFAPLTAEQLASFDALLGRVLGESP